MSRIWQFMCGAIVNELIMLPPTNDHEYKLLSNQDHENQDASERDLVSSERMSDSEERKLTLATDQVSGQEKWRNYITNVLLVALVMLVITNPERLNTNIVRMYATWMAGLVIYLNSNAFLLTNKCIVYCGSLSYVLYLVHWPIIVASRYCSDSSTMMTASDVVIILFVSFTISSAIHHTLEIYFIGGGVLPALACVVVCYASILSTKGIYLYAPPLESIDSNISKVEYAIEWNMRQLSGDVHLPCDKDDAQINVNYKEDAQWQCLANGNGTANIILVGNSFAQRAYPLIYNILKGRYRKLRLFSRSGCPPLVPSLKWCDSFLASVRKIVRHEKPDILMDIHDALAGLTKDPETYVTHNRYQRNIDFISSYTRYIVIDMPYYKHNFRIGAELARKLQLGLSLGDEFVVTWKQYIQQTRYGRIFTSLINCTKCIFNDISEGLFHNGKFLTYDPITFLARLSDKKHLTPVGLELLRPLYTRILEELLQELSV